jgi:hypothetical protein
MKNRTRFEKLARGCFALTLSLTEWMELEQILSRSRKARRMFRQRAQRRSRHLHPARSSGTWYPSPGSWLAARLP